MQLRPALLTLIMLAVLVTGCATPFLPARPTRATSAATVVVAATGAPSGVIPPVPTPFVMSSVTPLEPDDVATVIIVPSTTPQPSPIATPSPTVTPTPTLYAPPGVTIQELRARDYPGGPVEILRTLETTATYTRYYIAYPSDGLRITGIMQVPPGEGPFPVIILNHGYHDRAAYWAGSGTWMAAEYLNGRGYLTVAPDYRTWGESDGGPSLFHTGLVIDVLNLIASLATVSQADISRLGMWGHSMGGGITTKVLTVDSRVRAAVLYASNSADDADLIARWGRGCLPGETQYTAVCNPGESIPAGLPPETIAAYLAAAADPAALRAIAPIHHLALINAPVQIHIGTADGAEHNATPPEWSYKLHEALQASGRSSELFVYEGQGHLFAGQGWTEMIGRAADFFDMHVK